MSNEKSKYLPKILIYINYVYTKKSQLIIFDERTHEFLQSRTKIFINDIKDINLNDM